MPLLIDMHGPGAVPTDVPAEASALVVQACSLALAPDTCEERDASGETPPGAIVEWQDAAYTSVRIWVTPGEAGAAFHELHFVSADKLEDRFRATGLLISDLYRSEVLEAPEPVVPPPKAALTQTKEPPAPELPGASTWALHSLVGLQTSLGTRLLGRLEVDAQLVGPARLYAGVSLGADVLTANDLQVMVEEATLGFWLPLAAPGSLQLLLGGGVVRQWAQVSAVQKGESEAGATQRWGAEAQLAVVGALSEHWFLEGRGRLGWFPQAPKILVGGQESAAFSTFEAGALLGGGYRF